MNSITNLVVAIILAVGFTYSSPVEFPQSEPGQFPVREPLQLFSQRV